MTDEQAMRYRNAAKLLNTTQDPLYRELVVRVALDVAWEGPVSDRLYNDGLRAPADETMANRGRRVIVELA